MSDATGDPQRPLVSVRDLKVQFAVAGGRQVVRAVDGVSFDIHRGETLSLVGESGSGKTTVGQALLGVVPIAEGEMRIGDVSLPARTAADRRRLRRSAQMIFQDPYSSLNPRMRVGDIIAEPLRANGIGATRGERQKRVAELLGLVGLPADAADLLPHEFSGGQRQRIGIARAIATEPDFIICDEPVSALDVSIQAQIVNLLGGLQKRLHLTYLFIAHDLAVVRYVSSRIAVMYLGKIVEIGTRDEVIRNPSHPYTQALLAAVPGIDPAREATRQGVMLGGEIPSPINPPSGCAFHPRCPLAEARCSREVPRPHRLSATHQAACHLLADASEPSKG